MNLLPLVAFALAVAPGSDLSKLSGLEPGPFEVGVRTLRMRDEARTWPAADDPSGVRGRPIQITFWYPSIKGSGQSVTVEDYILADWTGSWDEDRWTAERSTALTASRRAFQAGLDQPLSEEQWSRARAIRGRGQREADPLPGRRALLLFETGLNGRSYGHAPLAEMLASRGYVVASLASFGRSESERLGFDLDGVRAQVDDMKVALKLLKVRPEIDPSRIALVAWSVGGVSQALLSLSAPGAFRAAVSLDSGTGYAYGADLLRQAGAIDPGRLRLPFLHFDAGDANESVPRDDSFLRAHTLAPPERHLLEGVKHGDLMLPYGVGRAAALGLASSVSLQPIGDLLLAFLERHIPGGHSTEAVTVRSEGWFLKGDLVLPDRSDPAPAVLLLNKAAGDRRVYAPLAERLARLGVASLRLDLRGHGESTNLGRFVPGPEGRKMIDGSELDVATALTQLGGHSRIDRGRIAVVGASYSGEMMMLARRNGGHAAAYVALSPGSLSDESIAKIDRDHLPFLLVVSRDERYLKEVTASLRAQSKTAEMLELGGTAHATDLLPAHPHLAAQVATWLFEHLRIHNAPPEG